MSGAQEAGMQGAHGLGPRQPISLPIPLPLSEENFERIAWLHHQLAPSQSAYELVWTHCQIVARIARTLAEQYRASMSREQTGTPRSAVGGVHAASASAPAAPVATVPTPAARFASTTPASPTPASAVSASAAPAKSVSNPWGIAFPDADLAYLGGLLHDIGVYRVFSEDGTTFEHGRYILHGLEGYRILVEEGFGEKLAQFARNHTGVGITRDEVVSQGLPLPVDDYMPRTIEQEIVMYADKFHTKSRPPSFVTLESARASAARFGESNAARFDALVARYGVPNLRGLADEYGMGLR